MMLAWQKQQVSKVGPHFLFFLVGEGILSPFDSTIGLLVNDCGPLNEPLGVGPGWENEPQSKVGISIGSLGAGSGHLG